MNNLISNKIYIFITIFVLGYLKISVDLQNKNRHTKNFLGVMD